MLQARGAALFPFPIPIPLGPSPTCVMCYGQDAREHSKALSSPFPDLSHQRDPAIPTKLSLGTRTTKIQGTQPFPQLQAAPQLHRHLNSDTLPSASDLRLSAATSAADLFSHTHPC